MEPEFLKDGPEVYQDVLVNGEVVCSGVRECSSRYSALKSIINFNSKPFTVLDVGANLGYFGLSILRDYPEAVVVMIDSDARLRKVVELNHANRAVVLERRFSVEDFREVSECEHFDVVLLMNVLHHVTEGPEIFEYCRRMGSVLVVETPDPRDTGACNSHLVAAIANALRGYKVIGYTQSHTSPYQRMLLQFEGTPVSIRKSFIDPTHGLRATPMRPEDVARPWYPGINLWTYHLKGGVYPSRKTIVEWVRNYPLPPQRHGDVRPWNFILGDGLHLIDGNDERANFDDEEGREETIRIMGGVK